MYSIMLFEFYLGVGLQVINYKYFKRKSTANASSFYQNIHKIDFRIGNPHIR